MLMNLIVPIVAAAGIGAGVVAADPSTLKTASLNSAADIIYTQIVIQLDSRDVLSFPNKGAAGSQLMLDTQSSSSDKFWRFNPTNELNDDNTFTFVNMETGWCVDANQGLNDFSPVTLNPCSGGESQIWTLRQVNGGYNIVHMQSNKCLNDKWRQQTPGSPLVLYQCAPNDPANLWAMNPAGIGNFWNYIGTQNNQVLDFPSTNQIPSPAGTAMQLYHAHGRDAQYFRFAPTGDGKTYTILNKETNYCLELPKNSSANFSPISLNTCSGSDIQKWIVRPGSFFADGINAQIVSFSTGKCLNVQYAKYEDHNPVVLYDCVNNDQASIWAIKYNALPNKQLISNDASAPIANVEVTVLLWGNVQSANQYPDFYSSLLNSRVFDMLGQYNIGRGTYKGTIQLPPPGAPALPGNNNPDIGGYLHQLVAGGFLTPNKNTYYAVHFAPNTGVTCAGYCAYHTGVWIGDIANQQIQKLPYGVMPDLNGCGCGGNSVFEAQTLSASHELVEAVTDPWGGYSDPVTGAEIGDLCAYRTFSISGTNTNYVIQKFWSNAANACVE
ncbi:hypothetical protein HDU76_004651 [Blyttiomyces sp. JEL0837]|nr:hypothetical protein HDU76_004651 [Blyttiomyces sp. JEL0837]